MIPQYWFNKTKQHTHEDNAWMDNRLLNTMNIHLCAFSLKKKTEIFKEKERKLLL